MPYKIAGIDVHKKVLMVVVIDATTPEEKPERQRFTTMPERDGPTLGLVTGTGSGRSRDGIHGPILALGVVGVGAVHAFTIWPRHFRIVLRGDASMTSKMPSGWCVG
jgi:hypothetical protein